MIEGGKRGLDARSLAPALLALAFGCGEQQDLVGRGDGGLDVSSFPKVPPGIYAVSGLEPGLPDEDLAPLGPIIGGAKLVGLGESVHTSGCYARAKSRLFRYLVERLGFRVLTFENPWLRSEAAAGYVATCQGRPEDALRGFFDAYADTHVRDLLAWMCEYNRSHAGDPLVLFGIDVQAPELDGPAIRRFLLKAAPADGPMLNDGMMTCDFTGLLISADALATCLSGLDAIEAYLETHRSEVVAATSETELGYARVSLIAFRAWQKERFGLGSSFTAESLTRGYQARDEGIAKLFPALLALRAPGARAVFWAHDWHISTLTPEINNNFPAEGAGTHFARSMGADYVAVGLTGYRVSIDWPMVGCGPLQVPTSPDSGEVMLHALGVPYLLVDLAFPGTGTPIFVPGQRYELGLGQADAYGIRFWQAPQVPAQQFRALLYLDESPAMTPVRRPPCGP